MAGKPRFPLAQTAFRRRVQLSGFWLASVLLLVAGFGLFSSAGRDDAYITYWPAHTLSHDGAVLNYNGDSVEQSSSLLHVLILAATHRLTGIDLALLGPLSSIVFGVASLALVSRFADQMQPSMTRLTTLLVGTSAYVVYWSFGGLETTLTAFAILHLLMACSANLNQTALTPARLIWVIVAFTVLLLARPEMPIVLISVVVGALIAVQVLSWRNTHDPAARNDRRVLTRRLAQLLLIALLLSAALIMFRVLAFDSAFPQPVVAKSGRFNPHTLRLGVEYLWHSAIPVFPDLTFSPTRIVSLSFAALLVGSLGYGVIKLFRTGVRQSPLLLAVAFVAVYTAFIVFSGGDWMEAGRFLVPMLPVNYVLAALALGGLRRKRRTFRTVIALVFLAQFGLLVAVARDLSTGMPVWDGITSSQRFGSEVGAARFNWFERANRIHLRDIPTIYVLNQVVTRLTEVKATPVTLMSVQMGMVAYYISLDHFGEVEFIDLVGITERRFTDCPVVARNVSLRFGLDMTWGEFFSRLDEFESRCATGAPDIIFDLNSAAQLLPDQAEYTTVYSQSGALYAYAFLGGENQISFSQFIAVRNDLLPALGDFTPRHFDAADFIPDGDLRQNTRAGRFAIRPAAG